MYVYRSAKFNDELIKTKELSSRVDSLCSQLETINYLDAKARFKKLHLYLKRKEGNFRLIARILKIDREPILCFLKVYNRGEPDYRHFLEAIKQHTELFSESELKPELQIWLGEEKLKNKTPQQSLSLLPNHLRIWLERPNWKIDTDDSIIHETEIWSKRFNDPEIRSEAINYLQLIEEVINNNSLGKDTNWQDIKLYQKNNLSILYLILDETKLNSQKTLLLIAPCIGEPTKPEIAVIINSLINHNNNLENAELLRDIEGRSTEQLNLTPDYLIASTKRSYPCHLILEPNFWLNIQNGNGVNLTLSEEEKEILNSVSTDKPLPLFLNGRAGSGKSTMLFYLFAYYCNQHLQLCHEQNSNVLEHPHPLFLTYSKNLSDFAKNKVQFLLRHHHLFVEDTSKLKSIPDIKAFFQPFRPFLLNLLPLQERKFFPEENYVSFYWFKEFCKTRWKKISPEKCWLVIQNFIKGYELDQIHSYLEDEHYYSEIIPKKDRSISVDEFVEIRDRVWKTYREYLKKNDLWDDRDLIRTVLSLGCYQPKYTAIFCDEAQDFTRLELQLIMRLSAFSCYDLEQEHIFSLPFACAGDPLQTLNPSGFRWESFKAAFYEEVLTPLDLHHQPYLKIELTPLKHNYRSVGSIVKVNNLIQLWRKILFDLSNINPQHSRKVSSIFCKKFIIDHNSTAEQLKQYLKNTIILIPCDEGEESYFVAHDSILRDLRDKEEPQKLPWNILSAISAKGLEFKQVVVYKFGERCPNNLWEMKDNPPEKEKYFLNKLYVATSRATERLFIIDSVAGETKLWHYASDVDRIEQFLSHIDNEELRDKWRENTDLIYPSGSLLEISNDDLEANALTFETVGIQGENIDYLERAIAAHEAGNNQLKASLCRAWKLRLEKDFLSAGKIFVEIGYILESWSCFWQALAWQELKQILLYQIFLKSNNEEHSHLIALFPLIEFMVTLSALKEFTKLDAAIEKFLLFTDFLIQESQQKLFVEEYHNKPWTIAISTYQSLVRKLLYQPYNIPKQKWLDVAQVLLHWNEGDPSSNYGIAARCFAFAQDYQQALTYWEKLGYPDQATDPKDLQKYYLTKAKVTPLPESLSYLLKAEKYALIINTWLKYGKNQAPSWLKYVALAYEATNHFEQAFIVYCYLDQPLKVKQCWEQIDAASGQPKYLKKILTYYLDKEHWEQAISLAAQYFRVDRLPYLFLYSLGQSQLSPDKLNKLERQRYQQFIQQSILHDSRWQQYITTQYLGVVLEKIGSFLHIFTFYEQYIESEDLQLRQFSRDRILVTKQQQINYFQDTNQTEKAQKVQQELTKLAKKWAIDLETLSYSTPEIELKKPHKKPQTKTTCYIRGLTPNIKTKTLAEGIYQFQLHHLIVRLMPTTAQMAIADTLSGKIVHFDGMLNKLQIDTTIITLPKNQPLSLQETLGNYNLALIKGNNISWEVSFNNYAEKIVIEFRIL
ncbi:MAG: hypothetical protein QNJ18_21565 [Xenococcaceae cyanobacterium MO_167.B52]|nr:hypothetical protein [Xenococcaceae cyanobacterium MO_167.B52]